MLALFQDLRYSLRLLVKNPGFAAAAVATLAVGIGANTVIFCVARSLLFPPLPYRDAGGIFNVIEIHRERGGFASSIPDFLDWKSQNHVFSQLAAVSYGWSTISGGSEPEDVDTAFVSEDFFPVFGVGPAAGRLFLPDEYRTGGPRVMILGYGFWQRQFGGAQDAIGRQLNMSGESCTVVGVMPPGFEQPFFTKAFLPLSARHDSIPADRTNRRSGVFGRLREDVGLEQSRREMSLIAARLALAYPATNKDVEVLVQPWSERLTGRFRPMIGLLLGAVAFVLLIGCVNVANLLMARASSRQREIAVRLALGARRSRLIRQLLTESVVLSAIGGLAGVILAWWCVPVLNGLYQFDRPFVLDPGVLGATLALTAVTAVLFGTVPALVLARLGINEVLKDRSAQAAGARSHRFRASLVVGELALSLVLLYGSALLIQSFHRYSSLDKGFNPQNVLMSVVNVYKERYPHGSDVTGLGWNVLSRMEHLPGQLCAAVTTPISLHGAGISTGSADSPLVSASLSIDPLAISSDYFRVMQITFLRGRSFTKPEAEQGSPVAVLSENLAARLWPREDALGKTVKLETAAAEPSWLTVVGIAREARGHSFPGLTSNTAGLYVPFGLMRTGDGSAARTGGNRDGRYTALRFFVRVQADPQGLISAARDAVLDVDRQQPVFAIQTMEEKLRREGTPRRALTVMAGVFAAVALLLATVGTYGVMAYAVSERTAEIGIRMALGAQQRDAIRIIFRQGALLLAGGVGLGLAGAVALSGVLESQLYQIRAADPATMTGSVLVLSIVSMAACYIPARRAARVDPILALRRE
jgi:putative ABC transport system permease protein